MRIYKSAYELFSEAFRDMHEMSIIVKPKSMQDKIIEGNDDFITKEIQHYFYALTDLPDQENLFLFEDDTAAKWCAAEFLERVNPIPTNPGEAWEIRKDVWKPFLHGMGKGKFSYTYNVRLNHMNGLRSIVSELHRNPDTRQAWLPIFHPNDTARFGGAARIPCSLGYFFMIREGKLNLTYIQRSADLVQHFGNDVYLAYTMMAWVTQQLRNNGSKVDMGYLYHHIFSLHTYKKDWDKLEAGISKLTQNG